MEINGFCLLIRNSVVTKRQHTQREIGSAVYASWQAPRDGLGVCVKHAAALGLSVNLLATQKATGLLGKQRHTVKHIPAMAWQDVPEFDKSIGETATELALRLLVMTAVRSFPLNHIQEGQIGGDKWAIPAEAM